MHKVVWRALLLAISILLVGVLPAMAQSGLDLDRDDGSVLVGVRNDVTLASGQTADGVVVIQGAALIDLPEAKSRVLDWVNRPENFLVVQDGDRHHLVQKERITRILEVREE